MGVSKDLVELVEDTIEIVACDFTIKKIYIIRTKHGNIVLKSSDLFNLNKFKNLYFEISNKPINISKEEYYEYISNLVSKENPHFKKIKTLNEFINSDYRNININV